MIRYLVATVAIVLCASAMAGEAARTMSFQDIGDVLVIPAHSSLRFKSWNKDDIKATFEGQVVVAGRFEIPGGDGDTVIFPDPDAAKHLPHWRDRGGPDFIYVHNPVAFEKAVLSLRDLDRLHRHKVQNLSGHVTAVVDHYTAQIECDAPIYEVTFVAIAKPTQVSSNQTMHDTGC